jgi:hypothetical protein
MRLAPCCGEPPCAAAPAARPVLREAAARTGSSLPERSRCGSGLFPEPPRSGSRQPRWAGQSGRLNGLERLDLLGLRALGPPPGGVLNPLVLLKAAVSVRPASAGTASGRRARRLSPCERPAARNSPARGRPASARIATVTCGCCRACVSGPATLALSGRVTPSRTYAVARRRHHLPAASRPQMPATASPRPHAAAARGRGRRRRRAAACASPADEP